MTASACRFQKAQWQWRFGLDPLRIAPGSASSAAREEAAFTLLELVLVLTILAILLVAVAPALSGFAVGRRPGEAATEFLSLTRYAHSKAIARGSTYRILVDPAHGRWWLASDESGNAPAEGELGHVFLTPDGVKIATNAPVVNGLPTLTFSPDGEKTPAEVTFTGPAGTAELLCSSAAGSYQIQNTGVSK
jgi:prepilin-type N-terminal cleavage/methylation domain-containing protein